jgi:protein-tyrosine phosphatase-like protein
MSQALDPVTRHHVRQAADALGDEFAGVFSQQTIERYISESLDLLGPQPGERLRARARAPLRS